MNRTHTRVAIVAGLAATGAALGIGVFGIDGLDVDSDGLLGLLALGGLLGAAYLLYDVTRPGSATDPVPWSNAGPIVETRPEATPTTYPLTGWQFADTLSAAAATARRQRRIESGLAVVREPLRDACLTAMTAGGVDHEVAERRLTEGTWTDDQLAAAVISPEVALPPRSLRQRLVDWLYPGRAVRRLTRRAVDAVARTADDHVPPVVGQDAPRHVPVYRPSLTALRRGYDGEIRYPSGRRPAAGREGSVEADRTKRAAAEHAERTRQSRPEGVRGEDGRDGEVGST